MWQVASETVTAVKKEATLGDLLTALESQSTCLSNVQSAAQRYQKEWESDPLGKLAATKLASPEFESWVSGIGEKITERIMQKGHEQQEQLKKLQTRGDALLFKIPNFATATEEEYRKAMAMLHEAFGSSGSHLRKASQEVLKAQEVLQKVRSSSATGVGAASGLAENLTQWHSMAMNAQGLGNCLVTHLTIYAMVTVLRAPVMGNNSDSGKKLAKNLQDLLRTLLEKDLCVTPEHSKLPMESAKKLCQECSEAVAS